MDATRTAPDAATSPYTPTHKIRFVTTASLFERAMRNLDAHLRRR